MSLEENVNRTIERRLSLEAEVAALKKELAKHTNNSAEIALIYSKYRTLQGVDFLNWINSRIEKYEQTKRRQDESA